MKFKILLILVCIGVVSVAGCINDLNSSDNNSGSRINQTYENQSDSTGSSNNSLKPGHYEASGYCPYVVDGDTLDVEGVGRIRLVGVNTPERGQPGYQEAKDFVTRMCLGKTVYLDIDDEKHYDKYGRVLVVVYAGNVNINKELLKRGYAEIMYIPPSEFPKGLGTLQ